MRICLSFITWSGFKKCPVEPLKRGLSQAGQLQEHKTFVIPERIQFLRLLDPILHRFAPPSELCHPVLTLPPCQIFAIFPSYGQL